MKPECFSRIFSQLPKSVTYITAVNSLFRCSQKQLDPPTNGLLSIESLFIFIASQVMHMKDELEREHDRKMTEMREAARRMKEDCSHQVEMERFSD